MYCGARGRGRGDGRIGVATMDDMDDMDEVDEVDEMDAVDAVD